MIKKAVITAVIFISLFCLLNCNSSKLPPAPEPINLTAAEKAILKSSNDFAFNIFREVINADPDTNIFVSPLSISYALGMTYNGAQNETEIAMRNTLGYGSLTTEEINQSYYNLTKTLMGLDEDVLFEIANSIWHRDNFIVEQDFLDVNRNYFDAEVQGLDFNDDGSANIINDWVSDKTHEKIKKIIDPPIPSEMVMYLINAIYFKGSWTTEFDPEDTDERVFVLSDGSYIKTDFMMREANIPYLENDDFQAIDLAYSDGDYNMAIFLPSKESNIDDFIDSFTGENWNIWLTSFQEDSVNLHMPKFKISYGIKLNDMLIAIGMGIAFDPFNADFGGINPSAPLFISEVRHKTFVQVDEEGTTAAAVTSVGVGMTSIGPEDIYMTIDHPFVFVIHERQSGAILFMGKIINPVWEE
jgi:serine protease inhibitor